jgi:beta-lactamase family protein
MLRLRVSAACLIVVAGVLQSSTRSQPAGLWPGTAWATGTLAAASLPEAGFAALDREIREGTYGNVDRVFVVRGGRAVVNWKYARNYDEISRGQTSALGCGSGCTDASRMHEFNYYHPNWHPYYQGRPIHTLQSVTKSIAATVIGVAAGRGAIAGVDRPLLSFFQDRDLSGVDPRLRRATLADLLTMRSGIEWHEQDRPLDTTNTTIQLEASRDWIQFTLDQPMDADPGTKWVYNSGGSQLLSGIIRAATGRFIDDYAREFLFVPIGIRDFHWKKTPTGHPDTEGGLYLAAEDLARIGYLYLHGGQWSGRQIVPPAWVKDATARHVRAAAPGWDYGYQWWLTTRGGTDVWAGRGFGGQFLIVIPARDTVAVINSWNIFGGRARNLLEPLLTLLVGE